VGAPAEPNKIPAHCENLYDDEQLERFFAKCSPRHRPIFKTFLMAGLRESELVFLTFDRLHLDRGVIRIDENPKYDFMPKAYQCRDVYIPPELVEDAQRPARARFSCGNRLA
jgi:integrase